MVINKARKFVKVPGACLCSYQHERADHSSSLSVWVVSRSALSHACRTSLGRAARWSDVGGLGIVRVDLHSDPRREL